MQDILQKTVADDQSAMETLAKFLKTAEGQELQQKLQKGVLDELSYNQALAQGLASFLKQETNVK